MRSLSNPPTVPAAVALAGTSGRRHDVKFHRLGDDAAHPLGGLYQMPVGKMGVARRRAVPPMPEQLADQRRLAGRRRGPRELAGARDDIRAFADGNAGRASIRTCGFAVVVERLQSVIRARSWFPGRDSRQAGQPCRSAPERSRRDACEPDTCASGGKQRRQ